MIIKNSGYRSWRNMISSGNRSKCFVEVFQILQNIMHSKNRYFLGFEDKRIEFIIGLSTTWTFVASCPVFYYAFLCGKSRMSDLLGYIFLDFRRSKPTVRTSLMFVCKRNKKNHHLIECSTDNIGNIIRIQVKKID